MNELTKEIVFYPAWDKRSNEPGKNYGINGVELAFYLKGKEGAIQFKVLTHWNLSHVQKEFDLRIPDARFPYMLHSPMPSDLGYHARVAQYDGQEIMTNECPIIGGPCYYDGSGLQAEKVFDILTEKGSEGVWKYLEEYYKERFLNKEAL